MNAKEVDEFIEWSKTKHEDKEIGVMKAKRGKIHNFLGMKLDCTEDCIAKADMVECLTSMVTEFPADLKKMRPVSSPTAGHSFKVRDDVGKLSKHKAETCHDMVARGLFVTKQSRGDIHAAMSFSCTKFQAPDADDWKKLVRLMKCIQQTIKLVPRLGVGGVSIIK